MTLQSSVDAVTKDLGLERCKHWLTKRTCSICSAPQIAAKRAEQKVETRSIERTETCKKLVESFDFDVFTLGFLAGRGYLRFGMAEKDVDRFNRDYSKLAGIHPDEHGGGYVSKPSAAGNDRWAIGGTISFRMEIRDEDQVDFGDFELHEDTEERRYYIPNTAFCWVLVALGFRLGRQDINRIRLRLEPKDVAMFDQGVLRGIRGPKDWDQRNPQ